MALVNDFPDELDSLPPRTQIKDVSDVFISDITIQKNMIEVKGSGTIETELNETDSDSYPFDFKLILNDKHEITDIVHLRIDTSSFYE